MNKVHKPIKILSVLLVALMIWLIPAAALAEAWSAVVMDKKLRFYKDSALTEYAGSLGKGEVIVVEELYGPVAKVSYKGVSGFFCEISGIEDVLEIGKSAVVNADGVKVYEKPDTSSKSLSVKKGLKVTVLATDDKWALIEANGYGVYMYKGYLTYQETAPVVTPTHTPEPPELDDAIECVVNVSSLTIYKKASAASTELGTLRSGDKVVVIAYNSEWAYLYYEGIYGYCHTSGLTKVEVTAKPTVTPTPSPAPDMTLAEEYRSKYAKVQFTATVICDDAPAYVSADTSKADASFDIGDTVDVYGYSKNWAYIGVGSERCFIAVKHLSSADYTALKSGDDGANTKKMQEALEKLGYLDSEPTGSYSSQTTSAVRRFQAQVGLSESGNADVATLRVLYGGYAPACALLSNTIKSGAKGDDVTRIQTRLYYLDYLTKTGSIDGDFGSITLKAVKLFQNEAGIAVTGVADPATLRALYSNNAPVLPTGTVAADYVASSSSNPSVLKIPAGLESTQSALPSNPSASDKIEYVIYLAQLQLGKPYIYATAGPNSFDCSGLTVYCYGKVGVSLGRSAYAHGYNSSSGTKIESISQLKRGDIVCFNTIDDSDLVDHVGIYIGSGYFIHASSGSSNGKQVCVSSLSSGYYNRVFSWARRPIE